MRFCEFICCSLSWGKWTEMMFRDSKFLDFLPPLLLDKTERILVNLLPISLVARCVKLCWHDDFVYKKEPKPTKMEHAGTKNCLKRLNHQYHQFHWFRIIQISHPHRVSGGTPGCVPGLVAGFGWGWDALAWGMPCSFRFWRKACAVATRVRMAWYQIEMMGDINGYHT